MVNIHIAIVVCGASLSLAINTSAPPLSIAYNREASIGPDGPWWFVTAAVGPQAQDADLIPGFSATTLVINKLACESLVARCPEPINGSLDTFDAEHASSDFGGRSQGLPAELWGAQQANILNLDGSGQYYAESMALPSKNSRKLSLASDEHAIVVSTNYTVRSPGGAFYTLSTGFFSLYAGAGNVSWPTLNGTSITRYRTLMAAYQNGQIPSVSFGIHVGSVNFNVSGSLTLGGYDRSRCITDPIVSDNNFVTLTSVSLGVAAGNSSFIGLPQGEISGLLRANGSAIHELSVRPNPGMPYFYLPGETCDAIASHLPITYNDDFHVYFWNVSDPAYEQIVKSPHYLSFTFASNNGMERSIDVPFALLNLNLTEPLVSNPTPYFPCSPWLPSATHYNFGRSFLQAAFLAQDWKNGKVYLAQAPGPDHAAPDIQLIADTGTVLRSSQNPGTWESTWSKTFEALAKTSTTSSNSTKPKQSSGGISKGTTAGAAVGALVGVALILGLLLWLIRRRKKARATLTTPSNVHDNYGKAELDGRSKPLAEAPDDQQVAEMSGPGKPHESNAQIEKFELSNLTEESAQRHEMPAEVPVP